MNRESFRPLFDRLIPLAARWVEVWEEHILRAGVPLTDEEHAAARKLGVRDPARVRLFCLAAVPQPVDRGLKATAAAIRFLTPATRGLALRYGIFVRRDCWRDRSLITHELMHTAQYERLGGIEPFLRQYLWECLINGYLQAPLEQEAILTTASLSAENAALESVA